MRFSGRKYDTKYDLFLRDVLTDDPYLSQNGIISDTLRALIIFARFKDDNYAGDPNVNFREWPPFDNPAQLPVFAPGLLAPSPDGPYPDSSLTAYFYEQSMGNLVFFGEVYDSVLVSRLPEAQYHNNTGGYGALTRELLDRIEGYGFDFSKYDYNKDGLVDQIFIVLRGDSQRDRKRFAWTGASCLDARCSGSIAGGPYLPAPEYDGVTVDWDLSGSYIIHRTPGNIIPFIYHVRLMAHEFGHDLWAPFFVHIPSYQRNDVPQQHNRGRGRDCIAYVLMAGSGGAQDCQGSQTISAYERDLLGWIDCKILDAQQLDVEIGDLYSTSDCFKVPLDENPDGPRLYLSNLQRIGYFDQLRSGGSSNQFDLGLLRATGLLATYVNGYGADVLPADNDLALATNNEAYAGDLFGPQTSTQLTPWTRPNSNGFNSYPGNFNNRWAAIDNIRYAGDQDGKMRFDFYPDFRENAIIRQNSWMGHGLNDFVFDTPFTVTNGSILTIQKDVTIAGPLLIDRQSKIAIEKGATLTLDAAGSLQMNAGAEIEVAGILVLDALLQRSVGTRIYVVGDGQIRSTMMRSSN